MTAVEVRERRFAAPRNMMREEMRCEPRYDADGQYAVLFLRGSAHPSKVVNISTVGAMLETPAVPCLDDHVVIAFDGCTPVHASVRWVKDGRVGVHFGKVLVLA
jgi:PilZ domain